MVLKWGIVSAGKISHDFVNAVNSYPEKGDLEITAVAARDKSNASKFAKIHNIPKVFDSYEDMARSKEIDIAYIGSLNPYHYKISMMFLENGKHVLCEKPLCLNYKQAKSLVDMAKKNKLFLMEAVWSRFAPSYLALEEKIASGKLGDVKLVEANFGEPISGVDRLTKKALGGSALLDLGIYVLQFAQFVFKEAPVKVISVGDLNNDGVDSAVVIILEYTGGRRAVLKVNGTLKLRNTATVTGTKGDVILEAPFHFPCKLIHADGSTSKFSLHESKLDYNFTNSAGLVYEALEAARCIKEGLIESPRMTHSESLLLAELEDTIRKQIGVHFDEDDQQY